MRICVLCNVSDRERKVCVVSIEKRRVKLKLYFIASFLFVCLYLFLFVYLLFYPFLVIKPEENVELTCAYES